jgi:hypothetical protein
MATRVDLPLPQVKQALEKEQASLKRAITAGGNPLIVEILQKDLAAVTTAANTLAETK